MIYVVIPSRGRKQQLLKCIDRLFETTPFHEITCIVVCEDDDLTHKELEDTMWVAGHNEVILLPVGGTAVEKWNHGARHVNESAEPHHWFLTGADDLWWQEDWLSRAMEAAIGGYVDLNDGHVKDRGTHYMVTKRFALDHLGGVVVVPHYRAWYFDTEAQARAKAAGVYVYAREAIVEHRHHFWGLAKEDETYKRAAPHYGRDSNIYSTRSGKGFPNDYAAVLYE
jgi:GT2 family glycosyltransferase